jgi:hypothetical protein
MKTEGSAKQDSFVSQVTSLLPDFEALYKDVHSHPELSLQETRTAGIAAERLRAAGYEVAPGIGKSGVVGVLRNGSGPTVMLRADMDALPVQEATGLEYASKVTAVDRTGTTVPVMHACGHDMHVTWLVGASTIMRADLYALAALAAAIVVAVGHMLHISPIATTIIGGLLCFALRYMAIRHGWHLPTARPPRGQTKETSDDNRPDHRRS